MSTELRASARIYTFPTRVRADTAAARTSATSGADLEPSATVNAAAGGSGWYHDAAIEQAGQQLER